MHALDLHPTGGSPYPKKSVNETLLGSGRACLGSRHLFSGRAPRYRDAGAAGEDLPTCLGGNPAVVTCCGRYLVAAVSVKKSRAGADRLAGLAFIIISLCRRKVEGSE